MCFVFCVVTSKSDVPVFEEGILHCLNFGESVGHHHHTGHDHESHEEENGQGAEDECLVVLHTTLAAHNYPPASAAEAPHTNHAPTATAYPLPPFMVHCRQQQHSGRLIIPFLLRLPSGTPRPAHSQVQK